jgi:hypothetical protein
MCVKHLIAIWEKDSISLWILELGICRSWSLTVVVCIIPLIPGVIIMGHSTIHPSWDRSGWRMAYLSSFSVGNFCGAGVEVLVVFELTT